MPRGDRGQCHPGVCRRQYVRVALWLRRLLRWPRLGVVRRRAAAGDGGGCVQGLAARAHDAARVGLAGLAGRVGAPLGHAARGGGAGRRHVTARSTTRDAMRIGCPFCTPRRRSRWWPGRRGKRASGSDGTCRKAPSGWPARRRGPPSPISSWSTRYSDSSRWPLVAYRDAYTNSAGTTVAALLAVWFAIVNVVSPGIAGAAAVRAARESARRYAPRRARGAVDVGAAIRTPRANARCMAGSASALFVFVNGVVFRTMHQWADVPWRWSALLASKPLQAALTLTWTATALPLMVIACRRSIRPLWMAGAVLLAIRRVEALPARPGRVVRIAARRRLLGRRRAAAADRIPGAIAAGGSRGARIVSALNSPRAATARASLRRRAPEGCHPRCRAPRSPRGSSTR